MLKRIKQWAQFDWEAPTHDPFREVEKSCSWKLEPIEAYDRWPMLGNWQEVYVKQLFTAAVWILDDVC